MAQGDQMDELSSLLGRNGFLPHGYCFTWSPGLLWSMVGADTLIAASYFSIPLVIVQFARARADFSYRGVAWLFSAFIFACGITHVMDVWTIWQPDYPLHALTKVVTALVSLATAVMLWRLLPAALRIPSAAQLRATVADLQAEIARRHTAEQNLAELQQSLALTLASIGAGFVATDREGRVTRLNSVAERVLGWTAAQAQGRSVWEVFQRDNRPAGDVERNPVDVLLERGYTVDTPQHVVAVSRDGRRTSLELKASPTFAEDGSVQGMGMVFRDVTGRLKAELESARLAAIVESSGDAIIGKTLDGRISSWNRGAEMLFGWTAQEAVGQSVQMLIPPDRAGEETRIQERLQQGLQVPAFDTVRVTRDGRPVQVSVSISPIRDRSGCIVGASKIARDVSLQRAAEAALRESESRLRFTLESAQIGDWDLDLSTGRATRSLRHDRCFGYDTLQPEWTVQTFLDHVHPDDRADIEERLRRSAASQADWAAECRVIWPDGSVHWISVHGIVRHDAGPAGRMVGIVTDITQQRQAEQARALAQRLEAENRQILEASRLKSQFLANMSHELRTPLNAVIGFADLLHSGVVLPESPKHREYLGHIGTSGRHLLQLINDVLDLSKVESGKLAFAPEPLDLPVLVREVRDVLHTAVQRKQLQLRLELDPALDDLVLDPGRLKQALYNYLSNAIKFTPAGGEIIVRARPEGPLHWRLEVEDSGIGIVASDLPRLFTEFQQLDAGYDKQHQGTGLGLALTRKLVQAQGGTVGVRSVPGEGSVFHLMLPRVHGGTAGLHAQPRLLVIEADGGVHGRLARALAEAGFDVDAAGSPEQALRQALDHAYGGITLDLGLPGAGVLDVLASIRTRGASRDSPVLGLRMPAAPGSAATFPVADVLFKPLRTHEVSTALARLRRGGWPVARVLVIDDDPLALGLMQATLAGLDLAVTCVADGRQALDGIDRHRPDAIVLDLMMPGFDGFAVLDALRRMPAWRHTPVLVWTAMTLTEDELSMLGASANAILGKGGGGLSLLLENLHRWRLPTGEAPQGAAG